MFGRPRAAGQQGVGHGRNLRARDAVDHVYMDDGVKTTSSAWCMPPENRPSTTWTSAACPVRRFAQGDRLPDDGLAPRARFIRGRGYVTPEDVKANSGRMSCVIGHPDLRGRAEEVTSDDVVRRLFDAVEVP